MVRNERRLVPIVSLDVAGYSRLIQRDEAGTLNAVRHLFGDIVKPAIGGHGGSIFKTMGDGILAEFTSVVAAVEWVGNLQQRLFQTPVLVADTPMQVRAGVILADVLVQDEDRLGDGVNLAVRVQGWAPPGGMAISKWMHEYLAGKVELAFTYKGRPVDVRQAGHELGVRYVVEGSVRRFGERVRITAQLAETESGRHIWAGKSEGAVSDLFDLQDRIAEKVAGSVYPSLRKAEIERARMKRPDNLEAYDLVMQALPHLWAHRMHENPEAIALLEQSLQLDPQYGLAAALCAWAHAQQIVYNWTTDIEGEPGLDCRWLEVHAGPAARALPRGIAVGRPPLSHSGPPQRKKFAGPASSRHYAGRCGSKKPSPREQAP